MKQFKVYPKLVNSEESRSQLIDTCDSLYGKLCEDDPELADAIINSHNACADDAGPEGFFRTMSNDDIRKAIQELKDAL